MRIFVPALILLVPAITQAQPPTEQRETSRWRESELVIGSALFAGGYARSALWASQSDREEDALYVPVLGPWLQLFSLPDCTNRDPFCEWDGATRAELVVDGVVQLAGVGLVMYGAFGHHHETKTVQVAPATVTGGPGVLVFGRF